MSKSNFLVFAGMMAVALSCGSALASPEGQGKCDKGSNGKGSDSSGDCFPTTPSLTWEDFKEACKFPEQFHVQNAPSNIRVQCSETSTNYVQSSTGTVPLPTNRSVTFAIFSDKFHVAVEEATVPPAGKSSAQGSCLRFKEVESTFAVEKVLDCNAILGIKGSLADYCAGVTGLAKSANPKVLNSHDTGKVIDTCSGVTTSDSSSSSYGKSASLL